MKRIALALLLLTAPVLAQPPPGRLEWRPTALGTIYMLWREPGRQATGWTLVRDQETNVWKLHHNGEAIDAGDFDAMRTLGITDAGP